MMSVLYRKNEGNAAVYDKMKDTWGFTCALLAKRHFPGYWPIQSKLTISQIKLCRDSAAPNPTGGDSYYTAFFSVDRSLAVNRVQFKAVLIGSIPKGALVQRATLSEQYDAEVVKSDQSYIARPVFCLDTRYYAEKVNN
jgi:hypothetical protein